MTTAVLLSGGVDSSVALKLVQEQGVTDITGFYLKIWLEDELSFLGQCPWQEDLHFVQSICKQSNIKLEVISLQKEYWDKVVSYTISELKKGRTPSPDLLCNKEIKFGSFFEHISDSFDCVVSGHYATIIHDKNNNKLLRGVDPIKDQSYFLAKLSQNQLARCLFPLGIYHKKEIRDIASKYELATARRPDSQGICFLGKISFNDFIAYHLGKKQGKLIEFDTGKILGTHSGYWFYTVGQRQGIGLHGGPWYVVSKNIQENIVYITHQTNLEKHCKRRLSIQDIHWIGETRLTDNESCLVKLRHGPSLNPATVKWLGDNCLQLSLEEADKGAAPGQFAVLYSSNECIGVGSISTYY